MASVWFTLPVLNGDGPQSRLIAKAAFTHTSYSVHVTDLTQMWSESLDRRAIIRMALNEDTSVDPSEDSEQLRILLEKIHGALKGDAGTSLRLDKPADGHLRLVVNSPLPEPLKPLQWSLCLSLASSKQFSAELVLPTLAGNVRQRAQIDSLLDRLAQKDHVIEKLIDKLDSSGVHAGMVFPGIPGAKAGKHRPTRDEAGRFVKGLAAFRESDWAREWQHEPEFADDPKRVIESLFGVSGSKSRLTPFRDGGDLQDDAMLPPSGALPREEDVGDGEFQVGWSMSAGLALAHDPQRQVTPDHLKPKQSQSPKAARASPGRNENKKALLGDDESTDDDDLAAPSQSPRLPTRALLLESARVRPRVVVFGVTSP